LNSKDEPIPGVVIVFRVHTPYLEAHAIAGKTVLLGRDGILGAIDERVSREHARISHDDDGLIVEDLGSKNGTYVGGVRIDGQRRVPAGSVVRVGRTLLLLEQDIRPLRNAAVLMRDDAVIGPVLRRAIDEAARAAGTADTLLVAGETGVGKELIARAFHMAGPYAKGPFFAVSCAAIPTEGAERHLFGAKRGAISGASKDEEGYVQAAAGGVLFLDYIAELELGAQAKVLRFLETREVMQLGATKPEEVRAGVCCTTNRPLAEEVRAGRFREDLYYRVVSNTVTLPPLRERAVEIPWIIAHTLKKVDKTLVAHVSLVEACLTRPWHGNVRELTGAIAGAAKLALEEGKEVRAQHLGESVGIALTSTGRSMKAMGDKLTEETIRKALADQNGNVSAAARALGVHRTQLYRLIERLGIDDVTAG
jgi:transcriptional regulator with PAS, ATPase and Fis domain